VHDEQSSTQEAFAALEERFRDPVVDATGGALLRPMPLQEFEATGGEGAPGNGNLALLMDVPVPIMVEIGRTRMPVGELVQLSPGAVIELGKRASAPLDILANGKLIARGQAVIVDGSLGVRITTILSAEQRIQSLT